MSKLSDSLAKAAAEQPESTRVPVSIGGDLYFVECMRLPGTVWDSIVARSPAQTLTHFRMGYDSGNATVLACVEHARLIDEDGEEEAEPDWGQVLSSISGSELRSISSAWWTHNEDDPDSAVEALKKAWEGRDAIVSS